MATNSFDDPFSDDEPRHSRDSHTVRLSAKVTAAARPPRRKILPWLARILIAFSVVWALAWYAIPSPMERLYPERKPVHVWHQWTGERKLIIDKIIRLYNESQTEYEVIGLSVPSNVTTQKYMLAVAGGKPPDVVTQWAPTVSGWAADGLIEPLDKFFTAEDWRVLREDCYPVVLESGSYNGKLYGMSLGLNTFGIYYQIERLRAVGYDKEELPDTLEELVELARKLDHYDSNGDLVRIGFLPNRFLFLAKLFGGGFNVLEDGSITIYTEENVRALEFLVDIYAYYGFERIAGFRSSLNRGDFATEWPFVTGQLMMAMDGQWRVEQLYQYAPDIKYKTSRLPAPKGGVTDAAFVITNLAFIPVGAREPQGGMEFIRFWSGLSDPQRTAEFIVDGGWMPTRKAVANAPAYQDFIHHNPQYKIFLNQLSSTHIATLPPVSYEVFLHDQLNNLQDKAVRGIVSAREALQELDALVRQERTKRERVLKMRAGK